MIAPGVSSTIRSTPVACSSARMLRPSRPMMRPFKSSLGKIDDRHGRLDRVLGGAALDGFGDVLARLGSGLLARFGVEALDEVRGIAPRVGLDVLQQQVFGFFGRQAGQPLELVLLGGDELLVFGGGGRRGLLALGNRLRLACRSFSLRSAADILSVRVASSRRSCCSVSASCWVFSRATRSASVRISCAFSLASSSASFLRLSASRSASL